MSGATRSNQGGEITNNAEADRIHSFSEEDFSRPDYGNTHSSDMDPRDSGATEEGHKDLHNRREQVDTVHRSVVHALHHEEGIDNDRDPVVHHSNDYAGAVNDGGNHHHDEGYIPGLEAGPDGCYSSHRLKDNPRDDMVATENDDDDRFEGFHFAPGFKISNVPNGIVRAHSHPRCSERWYP